MKYALAKRGMSLSFRGFCTEGNNGNENEGTDYNQWVLARSANHNHNIQHMKRKYTKDRFSIHKLTNLKFMCDLVEYEYKYHLTLNEKIILIAQMNHVIQVTGKNRAIYFQLARLCQSINKGMQNPDDLICLGTYMCTLASMGQFMEGYWRATVDHIEVEKYDEEYDELFGIIIGLAKYRNHLLQANDFLTISKDNVVPAIPVIYRNSLEILRQYITYNIFNLKQCKLIFQAMHSVKINEKYFWTSVRDWFNIYVKEQLSKKEFEEFFIMKESAVQRVLHDHGIIRPRPILQELITIVYVLSENGFVSYRFFDFLQDLIIFTIENGSKLYDKFRKIREKEALEASNPPKIEINEEIKLTSKQQQQNVKKMQKKYKTIFVNPIEIKDQNVVYMLSIFAKIDEYDAKEENSIYDKKVQLNFDPRVVNWLLVQLVKTQMSYTVKQLLIIINCAKFVEERSKLSIHQLIMNKLLNLRHNIASFAQIKQLMQKLPSNQLHHLNPLLSHFLIRNHPSQIHKMVKLLEQKNWIPYFVQFMLRLPKAVNIHHKYYSFEQNCYFLLMLLEYADCWSFDNYSGDMKLRIEFQGQMEELKEQIKIVTYTRGFKLTVNSYFHKILEKIDVVDFFEGGRG